MYDFIAARDWYCAENGITNNIPIYSRLSGQQLRGVLEAHGYFSILSRVNPELSEGQIIYHMLNDTAGLHCSYLETPFETVTPFILLTCDSYRTLFHELTHHRQTERKELQYYTPDGYTIIKLWRGREVHPNTNYYDLPFEIEAMKEEYIWERKWNERVKVYA